MKLRSLVLLSAIGYLSAQSARDASRQAYQAWRQAEPDLERDAGSAGAALIPRASRAAAAAAAFSAARSAVLRSTADDAAQRMLWLQDTVVRPLPDLAPAQDLQPLVSAASQAVTNTIATYANDPDRGIQQLRQSLERERAALTALSAAVGETQKATSKTAVVSSALEQTRLAAADRYGKVASGLTRVAALLDQETSAWASYYQKLPDAAQTNVQITTAPTLTPAPPQRATVAPPLPLARYVGEWSFPLSGGIFHGTQPESVDLEVREESSHVHGALNARFKLPPGTTGDSALRFTFEGDLQSGSVQSFPLVTTDGAKGTIDLIPGPAFNLLEVNFQTELKPGKIRLGNFILLKK